MRRPVPSMPGMESKVFSMELPMRLLSLSDVPGRIAAFTVKVPSLNGGRNSLPMTANNPPAIRTRTTAAAITSVECANANCTSFSFHFLRKTTRNDSL